MSWIRTDQIQRKRLNFMSLVWWDLIRVVDFDLKVSRAKIYERFNQAWPLFEDVIDVKSCLTFIRVSSYSRLFSIVQRSNVLLTAFNVTSSCNFKLHFISQRNLHVCQYKTCLWDSKLITCFVERCTLVNWNL